MSTRRYLTPLLCVMVMAMGHLLSGVTMAQTGPSLAGCPILPGDNVWNTPIDGLPIDPNSAAYITTIGVNRGVHPDFGSGLWEGAPIGIPYNIVPGTQPKVKITFDYDDESDPGPYPLPPGAEIEGGYNSDGDRHILVLDKDQCILYETWSTYPQPDGSWQAGSGAIFDLQSNALRPSGWTSADAAGLPILPGLVRYDEVASGEIRHAIRVTVPKTRKEFIWPARHYASNLTGLNYPPMGQRFRLKADFDISGFSPTVQVILRALKRYGMILADNGSAWFVSGVPDSRWDNDVLVEELAQVKGSDFEAVDESSLMIDSDSGQARQEGPGVLSVTPADGFISYGNSGGPFSPSSKAYTLQNTGGSSINWTASKGQAWVSLSGTSGSLTAGASTTVSVSINSNANSLSAGSYSDTVNFTNTTNGNGNTSRGVNLTVSAPCATPDTPSSPSPSNGATGISTSPTLSWGACPNTDSYDVYFGTSSNPPYVGNTTNTSYPRSGLSYNTLYYWKIVAKNNCGNSTSGPVWSFTTTTSGAPSIWTNIPGRTPSVPALAWNPVANKLQMVVRSANDSIWTATFNSSGVFNNDWMSIPGGTPSSPALVWNPSTNKLQMVVRASNDSIWTGTFNAGGVFNNDWKPIPGATSSSPALAWNALANELQIVVRASNDSIWKGSFNSSGVFNNDWTPIPGATPTAPALAWNPVANKLQMVVRASNDSIWTATFNSSGVFNNDWAPIPGATPTAPALAWHATASELCLVIRASNDSIWFATFNSSGSFNNDWVNIPGSTSSSPGMAYLPSIGYLGIVVRASNDTLWEMIY